MTRAEREGFLAEVRIGVLSIPEVGHGPLTAPVWYGYEPGGDLWFVTGRGSRKGRWRQYPRADHARALVECRLRQAVHD